MKKHYRIVFFVGMTGLLLATGYFYRGTDSGQAEQHGAVSRSVSSERLPGQNGEMPQRMVGTVRDAAEQRVAAHQTPKTFDSARFAPSLLYTQIDGRLAADAQGNLIVDQGAKDFFDYFLTAVGEVSLEDAVAEIRRLAETSLPAGAAEQALDLLDNYLAYERAKQAYLQQPLTLKPNPTSADYADHLQTTFDELKRLRWEHLGDEAATAFFAMEEAYGDYTVDAIRIQTDPTLAPEQKRQRLHAQAETLPEPLRTTKLQQIEEDLRAQAGLEAINSARNEAELRQKLSAANFTADKAEDLVRFWHQDRAFQTRYEEYDSQRVRIESSGLAVADREQAIEQLRLAHFETQQELMRAKMRDLER